MSRLSNLLRTCLACLGREGQVGGEVLREVGAALMTGGSQAGEDLPGLFAPGGFVPTGEAAIETELGQIYQEIDRIGSATSFNGTAVFSDATRNIFVGDTQNLTASNAQIAISSSALSTTVDLAIAAGVTSAGSSITVDIDGTNTATVMLGEVEAAIDEVASRRGSLGASMNRLENAVSVMQSQVQNLTAAESQIRDADFAAEIANLTKFQILSQVGVAAMAQANAVPQSVLSLFQ